MKITTLIRILVFTFFISCFGMVSCDSSVDNNNNEVPVYGMSYMKRTSKDTITSKEYRVKCKHNELPSLAKCSKSRLRNDEERKYNNYYLYYDSLFNKMYNIKELINNKDTLYVVETKIVK